MGAITVGVDIGQRVDPTALAVCELVGTVYHVRFLERLQLNVSYPDIARRIGEVCGKLLDREAERLARERLTPAALAGQHRSDAARSIWVVADATGVGAPVCDLLRAELKATGIRLTAAFFTHGDKSSIGWGVREATVGKAYLVSRLQALIQAQRILLPKTAEAEVLASELLNYEIRIDDDANLKAGAFKVGTHDDMATALGLSVIRDWPGVRKAISIDGYTGEVSR